MFRPFGDYTHKRMQDVFFRVIKSFRCPDGRYKLKVHWFNRRGLDLGIIERVVVQKKDVKDWLLWLPKINT